MVRACNWGDGSWRILYVCPTPAWWDMTTVDGSAVKIDSKGRILLPPGLRNELEFEPADVVSLKKTREGVALTRGAKRDFLAAFKQMLETPPTRLGKPENPAYSKMKRTWKTA